MSESPLVTIGAINYNNAKYVIETLKSIKAQTYENLELVIVDDYSTDNSVALIKNWLQAYNKRFTIIVHERNLGVCATCNDILKNATGKYLSYIATDDIMMPDKIKNQVVLLQNSDSDVGAVYSDAYLIKEDSSPRYGLFIQRLRDFEDPPNGELWDDLLKGNFLPAMSLMVKMECFQSVGFYDENLRYEDYDMWLRISKKYKIIYSDYVSCKYRIRKNSLTTSIKNWEKDILIIMQKHIENLEVQKIVEDVLKALYRKKMLVDRDIELFEKTTNKHLSFKAFNRFNIPYVFYRLFEKIKR